MPKENEDLKLKKEVAKFLKKLPPDIASILTSEEAINSIVDICFRNGIKIEKVSDVTYCIGLVLLGQIKQSELSENLGIKAGLRAYVAEKVAREIDDQIFFKVKGSLLRLSETEKKDSSKKAEKTSNIDNLSPTKPPLMEDVYREPIE